METRRLFRLFIGMSLLLFLLQSSIVWGQTTSGAVLGGRIEDATGAAIPSASVLVTSLDRHQTFAATSDENGRFRFSYLPVGAYQLRIEQAGFEPATTQINLSVGQVLEIPIRLAVAGISTEVDVAADLPLLELGRTQVSETIAPKEIDSLPLNGRNYMDLALLLPAVSKTNTGNNERFAETSAVPGTGISVAGQRNLGNGFVVDGLSANDDAADLAGTFFSQEVIREFQVITSGGIAEFGRAYGGVVNVITQSGTNDWHGDLYGFLRNQRFDATHRFAAVDPATRTRIKSPLTQGQYGITAGGPLRRDRAFLFTNFEREDLNRSGFITISPSDVRAINEVLDRTGYAPPRVSTGEYPTGDNRTSFFAKADLELRNANRLTSRYSLYDISSPNARNVGALNAVSRGTIVADRDQTIAINDVASLNSRAANEARLQWTRSRFHAPGNDQVGPAVSIAGIANFGASTSSPTERDIDMAELADTYTTQVRSHFVKFGADLLYNRVNIVFPGNLYGTYSFSSLPNFLSGNYSTFGQAFGKTDWLQTNPNLSWFAQDEWKLGKDLTLNLGLRHDMEWHGSEIKSSKLNFAPRAGLAYSAGSHKTVIRAGFGQYYDRIPLRAVANALRGAGVAYKTVSLQRTQIGAPGFADKLSVFPAATLFNLATIDPRIKNAYALQGSLQVEQELSPGMRISAGYLYLRGIHIIMQRNLNVPSLTASEDPVNLGRPNAAYGNITQYSGQGDSYYNGLTLTVERRSARWISSRLSYTVSKSIDDTGNFFFSAPEDNFDLRDDRGLSDNDQRHHLAVSAQFTLPPSDRGGVVMKAIRGFQLSPIFTYGSPYPFNIVTGGQTIQTTAARPSGVGRNTGIGFRSATLDVRLNRQVRIADRARMDIIVEAFNVLNETNLQFPNATFGTGAVPLASFGMPTNAGDPRQVQFGLKLSF